MKRSVFIVGVGLVLLATALLAWLDLAGGKRTFEVKGRVAGFGGERAVYVEHGEVLGYLPARTTPFRAQRADQIDSLAVGDAASFALTATPSSSWITNIEKLLDNAVPRNPASIAKKQTDNAVLETGEQVSDVEFVDQDGRAATDPVTGAKVDKATAVVGALPDGSVRYFESEKTLRQFSKKDDGKRETDS